MQIDRKIRDIRKYLRHVKPAQDFYLGLPLDYALSGKLAAMGFGQPPKPGERKLPAGSFGPASRRNADGFEIVHRDKPMETAYRQMEWHWQQFNGRYDREDVSKVVDVPYQRYPRTHIAPYGVELEIRAKADGSRFVLAGPFNNIATDHERATNAANMLVEQFGAFEILDDNLTAWVRSPIHRLNWQLLPPGRNPWESAKPILGKIVQRLPEGNQPVIRARLEAVGAYGPDFVAVGLGGFEGYAAFGFQSRRLCILECPHVNNATYALDLDSWEEISQLSKAEILDARAHRARIVHTRNWFDALAGVLGHHRQRAA